MKPEYTRTIKTEKGEETIRLVLSKIDEKTYEITRDVPAKYTAGEIEEELLNEICKDADKEEIALTIHLIDAGEIDFKDKKVSQNGT